MPQMAPVAPPKKGRLSGAPKFDHATFEATLYEVKHQPSGDMRVVIVIPQSDNDEGVKLKDAYGAALLVTVAKMGRHDR